MRAGIGPISSQRRCLTTALRRATMRCAWLLALAIAPGCSSRPSDVLLDTSWTSEPIHYALQSQVSDGAWAVVASIPSLARGARVCAPAIGTRQGEALEWIEARADGRPVRVAWARDGCFTVPALTDTLTVRYRVRMTPAPRPAWRVSSLSPYADGRRLVFPGETLFLEVGPEHPLQTASAVVKVAGTRAPLHSTLPRDADLFTARDNETLLRSMWWVDEAVIEERGRTTVGTTVVAREASLVGLSNSFTRDVSCLHDQLATWAPGRQPADGTVFVFEAQWDASARTGFARKGGVVLQVGEAFARDAHATRRLLAHELFHRINGQGLHYDDAEGDATNWFHEGTTSYVAAVTLVHAGLAGVDDFLAALAEHASSYLANPARDAAAGTELDWARLPYDRGVLLSLAIDLFLRDISNGTRSLQGFWQHLARTPQWDQAQTAHLLRAAMSDYAGVDMAAFFDRYVDGAEPLPVHALLRHAGLTVTASQMEVASYGMAVDYDVERMALVVTAVAPGDTAAQAGVQVGDVLEPAEGTDFAATDAPIELVVRRGSTTQFARLKPRRRAVAALALAWRTEGAGPLASILEPSVIAASCPGR